MRENNRNSIEKCRKKLPQFTTMNVIDGQAGLISYFSLIFYSLTIDNILNIIVLLILAGVSIAILTGENGILTQAQNSQRETEIGEEKEQIALAYNGAIAEKQSTDVTADDLNRNFGYNDTKATATGSNPITVIFTESGRKYEIDKNGNITEAGSGTTPEEPETESTLGIVTGTETSNTTVQDNLK